MATPQQTADKQARDILGKLRINVQQMPAVTPALLAYLRGMGMQLGTAEQARAQTRSNIGANYTGNTAEVRRASTEERRNLTGDLVTRGVLRSGEANRRYAQQSARTNERLADLARSRAQGLTGADQAYRGVEEGVRAQALERLLQVETTEAERKATEAAQLRQQQSLTDYYNRLAR